MLRVYDLDNGHVLLDLPQTVREGPWLARSPDGYQLAVGCSDRNVYIWDTVWKGEPRILRGHEAEVTVVGFSRSGLLASSGWDATTRGLEPRHGKALDHRAVVLQLQFSPDDRKLAFSLYDSSLILWEVNGGREFRSLSPFPTTPGRRLQPGWSIPSRGRGQGGRIWDLVTSRAVAHWQEPDQFSVLFEPGGDGLITCGHAGLPAPGIGEVGAG